MRMKWVGKIACQAMTHPGDMDTGFSDMNVSERSQEFAAQIPDYSTCVRPVGQAKKVCCRQCGSNVDLTVCLLHFHRRRDRAATNAAMFQGMVRARQPRAALRLPQKRAMVLLPETGDMQSKSA